VIVAKTEKGDLLHFNSGKKYAKIVVPSVNKPHKFLSIQLNTFLAFYDRP
jgi:hypothetical protein